MATYWKTGMRITSARLNRALPVAIRKQVASSKTSDTALATDNELVLPLLANTTYSVTGGLLITGGDNAGDFQYAWSWTGTMTIIRGGIGPVDTITSGSSGSGQFARQAPDSSSPSTATGFAASTTGLNAQIVAWVEVGATAGDLSLLWAQLSSNGTATTLEAGSSLVATPIGFN